MKKLIQEIKVAIISPYFFISIVMMVLLCLISSMPNSYFPGEPSVIECILNQNKSLWQSDVSYSSYEVFKCYDNFEWFPIIMPTIVGFTSVYYIGIENETKFSRFILIRMNMRKYILLKMISSGLIGGITVIIGILIYGLIVYSNFYNIEYYMDMDINILQTNIKMYDIFPNQLIFLNRITFLVKKLTFTFLTGFLMGIITYLFLIFIRNKFLTLTFPIIINYLSLSIISKFIVIDIDKNIIHYWLYILCPCWHYNMYYAFPQLYNKSYLWYISIFLSYIFIIFISIYCTLRRRVDICE